MLKKTFSTAFHKALKTCLCAIAVIATFHAIGVIVSAQQLSQNKEKKIVVKPSIHKENRANRGKVFLEKADSLLKHSSDNFIILHGKTEQVKFRHGEMFMTCDSAYFFDQENSFNAYGNVHMWQGDTLHVYADSVNYLGDEEHAILYAYDGNTVKLINRDVKLETDIFEYDLKQELGFYTTGGIMTDKQNRLESIEGDYSPATKQANFYGNVYLRNNSNGKISEIFSESLHYNTFTKIAEIDTHATIISDGSTINTYNADYNTNTHIARLKSPSTITNKDGTIYTDDGDYNTNTKIANLYAHSKVKTKDNKVLEGDTLFYDRNNGYGEAYGNMILTDFERKTMLKGDYGYYNEVIDSVFVTGNALAMEYSKGDTLYMHGDTIRGFRIITEVTPMKTDTIQSIAFDTTHLIVANPRVRIFRSDLQGVCDSMTFRQQDSLLIMNKYPIIWSGQRQIFGNIIEIHFNDSTANWARLPEFGFAAEEIEDGFFNQLSGKEMFATFEDENLKTLNINGNVQAIYLPLESDSTYNKIVNIESSFLEAHFNKQNLERCKIWSQSNGTVTPLYLAKKSLYYLPQFKWYESIRPKYPMDVFNVSSEMEELLRSGTNLSVRRSVKR
ncbi:MAG: hypothetical protein E7081_04995 [Bacteroidales bacterium]|nr:hypothetical protein [Bacteroidales bacterium]